MDSDSDLVGKRLGRYDIRETLGRGGTGCVYKAWDTTLDRWVAVKILDAYLAADRSFRQRFEREAKTIAALNHPNIIDVYDFGFDEAEKVFYIVLEYLPAGTLTDYLATLHDQTLDERLQAVKRIFPPLVDALSYAHEQDMIHRDIKPGNILFNEMNQPVLADFGLARMLESDRLTVTGATYGTPTYMSPEQGLGEGGNKLSDIYALGVILFEMVTGEVPFKADNVLGLIVKKANDPVPELTRFSPGAPLALQHVVDRALAQNPDARHPDAQTFLSEVIAAIDGESISQETITIAAGPGSTRTSTTGHKTITPADTHPMPVQKKPGRAWIWVTVGAVIIALLGGMAIRALLTGSAEMDADPESQPMAESTIPAMTAPVEIFDDFSDEGSGWPILDEGPVRYQYENGLYRFTNELPGQARLVIFEPSLSYGATYLEVKATLIDGQPESGYGLVFRWQDDGNFYIFAINGLGQVSMWAFENGTTWRELRNQPETWMDSEAVYTDGRANTLTLIAQDNHLVGRVNYEVVITVDDDTFDRGAVGLYTATTMSRVANALADVTFDDFVVQPSVPAMTP